MKKIKKLPLMSIFLATAILPLNGAEGTGTIDKNPLMFKPAFELTDKDQVLLDILHHENLKGVREDFSTLEEVNGAYPEPYEKAFQCFQSSIGSENATRERYLDAITNAANYLLSLFNPTDTQESEVSADTSAKNRGGLVSLLIGINYKNTKNELWNCVNDIEHVMEELLVPHLGMNKDQFIIMSDYQYGTDLYPTRYNILKQFDNFISRANLSNEAYFHYSGHGSYTYDSDGDEIDRRDEVLVPIDYDRNGGISDDELFKKLVKGLNPSVKLTVSTDCCHSGTILDLPYKWTENGVMSEEKKLSYTELKSLPNIVMLSGCKDDQTSADGATIAGSNKGAGAMTAAFLETLRSYNYVITYRQLLDGVNKWLIRRGYTQRPQLSSTYILNLDDYYMKQQTTLRP